MTDHLAHAKRVIVKVGSRLLVNSGTGVLNGEWLTSLIDDLTDLLRVEQQIANLAQAVLIRQRG